MWTYRILDHLMVSADGTKSFTGYSGAGHTLAEGRNNPVMADVQNRGPIPPGDYAISPPYDSPHTGPYTLALDPMPFTKTFGRSEFRIHGNNSKDDASHGCIILPPDARRAIWESGDHQVRVTE